MESPTLTAADFLAAAERPRTERDGGDLPPLPPLMARIMARAAEPAWWLSPASDPDAHAGLRRLRERTGTDWTGARRLALEAGVRFAWAAADRARRVRLGRQYITEGGEAVRVPLGAYNLREGLQHLRREAMTAAADWLAERPYSPEADTSDPLDDAAPVDDLNPGDDEALREEDPLAPLEARPSTAWDDLLQAAPADLQGPLEALTDGQRERLARLLELVERTGDVTEAKRQLASEEGVTVAALDTAFHRMRRAV